MLTLALSPESEDIALPTHRRVHKPEASLTFSVWRSHWRARHRHDHLTGHTLEPGLQHSPLLEAAGCGGRTLGHTLGPFGEQPHPEEISHTKDTPATRKFQGFLKLWPGRGNKYQIQSLSHHSVLLRKEVID